MVKRFFNDTLKENTPLCIYPSFAANIRFEYWEADSNNKKDYIKFLYNSMEYNLCPKGEVKGGCTLKELKDIVNDATKEFDMEDYEE